MKALWLAFGAIFIAELGDKTQLAVFAMKAKGMSGMGIFFGAMLAFALVTGIAILLGDWVNTKISSEILGKAAAVGFVVIGVFMWFGKL
ncbi:MAG: TMEM165/GDT1 family protein [Candidatus Marinimicrobia bacterium]|nr:TMEM165/GDT1 family protein [Candidatus Neomarinimicrobiota bacterium]MCH7763371.1 TMEM165/GDT1 family protein [Candidatus Neomarinimicrobiota bacterium]